MYIVSIRCQENPWEVSQLMFVRPVRLSQHSLKQASMMVVLKDTQLALWWLVCYILSMHGARGKILILSFLVYAVFVS